MAYFLCGGDDVVTITEDSLAQYPNLWRSEVLGDPCSCVDQCGGTKILPASPKAKLLATALSCGMCGEQQFFQIRRHHHANCIGCDPDEWGKKTVQDFPAGQEFRSLLLAAAHRKGMTLGQIMDAAGIDVSLVSRWANGGSTPYRHYLERLAEVAECPELIDSIPSNVAWVTNTCPTGHKPDPYPALYIRREIKRGSLDPDRIDWATGSGTFACGACQASSRMYKMNREMTHNTKGSKAGFWKARGENLAAKTTHEEKLINIKKAQEANIGRPQTKDHRLKASTSKFSPNPQGSKWNVCRLCGFLVFTRGALVGRNRGEVHGNCLNKWISDNHVRARRCYPEPQMKINKRVTSEYLAVSYELVVRVVLRKEPVGETKHQGLTVVVPGVAEDLGLKDRAVFARINEFINLLPPDGCGGKKLSWMTEVIRWADSQRPRNRNASPKLETELTKMEIAEKYLTIAILSTELVPSVPLFKNAANQGIKDITLRRAIKNGRYAKRRIGKAWYWRRKRSSEA